MGWVARMFRIVLWRLRLAFWLVAHRGRTTPMSIRLVVLTPLRLLGESLRPCLIAQSGIERVELAFDFKMLSELLASSRFNMVLIDVSHGLDTERIRAAALRWPEVRMIALGPEENRDDVIRCAQVGFAGYVARNATLEELCRSVLDAERGKAHCTAEIAGHLMQALFCVNSDRFDGEKAGNLTPRESEVARLLQRGFSNKDIARRLHLSVATVKHHVHHVLSKLSVERRIELVRDARSSKSSV